MKVTKCDRCGKIFDPYTIISVGGMSIKYPLKLTFESICWDCLKEFREGDKDENN